MRIEINENFHFILKKIKDRHSRLKEFLQKIKNREECQKDLTNWNVDVNDDLLKLEATHLASVELFFRETSVKQTDAGWDAKMKNANLISTVPLKNWVLIYSPRDSDKANFLSKELIEICRSMQFNVERPQM